jgi:hypothetical protein
LRWDDDELSRKRALIDVVERERGGRSRCRKRRMRRTRILIIIKVTIPSVEIFVRELKKRYGENRKRIKQKLKKMC